MLSLISPYGSTCDQNNGVRPHNLLTPDSPTTTASTNSINAVGQAGDDAQPTARGIALNMINASGQEGVAAALEKSLVTGQLIDGTTSHRRLPSETSTIAYGMGAEAAAATLPINSESAPPHRMLLPPPRCNSQWAPISAPLDYIDHTAASTTGSSTASVATPITTVPATGTGSQAPASTDLTRMTADDVPCMNQPCRQRDWF